MLVYRTPIFVKENVARFLDMLSNGSRGLCYFLLMFFLLVLSKKGSSIFAKHSSKLLLFITPLEPIDLIFLLL